MEILVIFKSIHNVTNVFVQLQIDRVKGIINLTTIVSTPVQQHFHSTSMILNTYIEHMYLTKNTREKKNAF
jgi:hypothetical protein